VFRYRFNSSNGGDLFMVDFIVIILIFGAVTYIALRDNNNEFSKLFKACKIINPDKKVPLVIEQRETDYGQDVVLYIPEGLSLKDIENKKDAIEQYLGAKIELFNIGNQRGLMRIMGNKLLTLYRYKPMVTKGEVELPVGMSLTGAITLKLDDSYPSCLIGGTAGSGKSVCLRCMITNCIVTKNPKMLKLHLCDLKYGVEFSIFQYSKMVETFARDIDEALALFYMLEEEMYQRYKILEAAKVVNITEYNKKYRHKKMPYHLVFIDEFANLKRSKEALELIDKLLRMARAVGIHFVIATQRPDAETIPGELKANLQATIAFKVRNEVNSRILLDYKGAENLRGQGHGILQTDKDVEFQGWYLDIDTARRLIEHTNDYSKKKVNKKIEEVDDTSGVIPFDYAKSCEVGDSRS